METSLWLEFRACQCAIWTYVSACFSAGGHMDLRFCMSERRAKFDGDMDLRFLHVSAPAIIWTYVCACLSDGGDMELRLCISQRRRSYGLTFMYI